MPIASTDIKYKFSVKTGSAGNTTAGTAAGSLGKYISTTEVTTATLHNLFDVVTGDENAASESEYRCIFLHNTHATLTWQTVIVWIESETASGASVAIAVDSTSASDADAAPAQALEITNEDTAPAALTFTSPTTKATGVAIGSLTPDQVRAIWVRRTAANSAALATDGAVLKAEGDSA